MRHFALLVLVCGCAARAAAQSEGSVLPNLSGSTRMAAMGGVGVAILGDAAAIFDNPAGIAPVRHVSLEASFEPYLAGTNYTTAALALRLGQFNWGVGGQTLDYGSEPVVVGGTPTGETFHAVDLLGTTSLVYRRGIFALGGGATYARQDIGLAPVSTWAGNVGLGADVFEILEFGVSVLNLGGDFGNGSTLGRRTRAGFTTNYVNPQATYHWLATVEGEWPEGAPAQLLVGLEGGLGSRSVGVTGRIGYATRSPTSAESRWSVGGGLRVGKVNLDYAYQTYNLVGGPTHRVGMRWST